MKILKLLILGFTICFLACGDNNNAHDCEFVMDPNTEDGKIDAGERAIMDECLENRLSTPEEIQQNLIGTWALVGFGHGWFYNVDQPCSTLVFSDNTLEVSYTNAWTDTLTVHTYEVVQTSHGVAITIEPHTPFGIGIGAVCDRYLFGDATPVDGNMHLYIKLE